MIPPVTDVRPRIIRLDGFPVEPTFGHAVGVISFKRGGVQELLKIIPSMQFRIGMYEGFPVLEYIPPSSYLHSPEFWTHQLRYWC